MKRALLVSIVLAATAAFAAPVANAEPLSPLANSPTGATLTLSLTNAGREDAVVVGKTFGVHGIVNPFQAGQQVTVTFTQRGAVAQETVVPIGPVADGTGAFGPPLANVLQQFPGATLGPKDQTDFVCNGSDQGVRYGQNGQGTGRMPGFGSMLTDEQIQAIVEYVRGL